VTWCGVAVKTSFVQRLQRIEKKKQTTPSVSVVNSLGHFPLHSMYFHHLSSLHTHCNISPTLHTMALGRGST
jgi:hypothetical protein